MHLHYGSFRLSTSLQKFQRKPLFFASLRAATHSVPPWCSAGEIFLQKIMHVTLPLYCRQALKGGNIPFLSLCVKSVVISKSTHTHQSATNIMVAQDQLFGSSTSLGIAAQHLVPAACLNCPQLQVFSLFIPNPTHRSGGFTIKKSSYPNTIVKGADNQVPVFPTTLVLQASLQYCHLSLSFMYTQRKTKAKKMQTYVTAEL